MTETTEAVVDTLIASCDAMPDDMRRRCVDKFLNKYQVSVYFLRKFFGKLDYPSICEKCSLRPDVIAELEKEGNFDYTVWKNGLERKDKDILLNLEFVKKHKISLDDIDNAIATTEIPLSAEINDKYFDMMKRETRRTMILKAEKQNAIPQDKIISAIKDFPCLITDLYDWLTDHKDFVFKSFAGYKIPISVFCGITVELSETYTKRNINGTPDGGYFLFAPAGLDFVADSPDDDVPKVSSEKDESDKPVPGTTGDPTIDLMADMYHISESMFHTPSDDTKDFHNMECSWFGDTILHTTPEIRNRLIHFAVANEPDILSGDTLISLRSSALLTPDLIDCLRTLPNFNMSDTEATDVKARTEEAKSIIDW